MVIDYEYGLTNSYFCQRVKVQIAFVFKYKLLQIVSSRMCVCFCFTFFIFDTSIPVDSLSWSHPHGYTLSYPLSPPGPLCIFSCSGWICVHSHITLRKHHGVVLFSVLWLLRCFCGYFRAVSRTLVGVTFYLGLGSQKSHIHSILTNCEPLH